MTYGCPKCGWSIPLEELEEKVLACVNNNNTREIFNLYKCPECGHPIPCDILGI